MLCSVSNGANLNCIQVRRLAMYKKRAVRDKRGKVIHEVCRYAIDLIIGTIF